MHADFRPKVPVSIIPLDDQGSVLDAGLLPSEYGNEAGLVPLLLRPSRVHAQEHFGPILALHAAGPRIHGENGVRPVFLRIHDQVELQALDFLEQGRKRFFDIAQEFRFGRFFHLEKLEKLILLVESPAEVLPVADDFFKRSALSQRILGGFGVVPEILFTGDLIEPGALRLQSIEVKAALAVQGGAPPVAHISCIILPSTSPIFRNRTS